MSSHSQPAVFNDTVEVYTGLNVNSKNNLKLSKNMRGTADHEVKSCVVCCEECTCRQCWISADEVVFTFSTDTTPSHFSTNKRLKIHFILPLEHLNRKKKLPYVHRVRGSPKTHQEHTGLHLLSDLPMTQKSRTTQSRTVLLPHSNLPCLSDKETSVQKVTLIWSLTWKIWEPSTFP